VSLRRRLGGCVNGFLEPFGLRLSAVQNPEAILDPAVRSIAKGLSTREHNSRRNMDAIYSDPNLLTHYFTSERMSFYATVRDRLSQLPVHSTTVLDVGCGCGQLLNEIKKVFPDARLEGVDFSPESIRVARKLSPAAVFDVLSIFELEKLGRQFDLVLCTEVLEHLEDADLAMEKLVGRCQHGGTLVITVPQGRLDTFAGHFNFWTPESFRREFRGLNPQVEELNSYLFIVIRRS
jgi:2-polyprenyl-3-methyl-5-hydroxy-6-metoxy-1,4-benzoquinol methylase